jgi:hypothetical protein
MPCSNMLVVMVLVLVLLHPLTSHQAYKITQAELVAGTLPDAVVTRIAARDC